MSLKIVKDDDEEQPRSKKRKAKRKKKRKGHTGAKKKKGVLEDVNLTSLALTTLVASGISLVVTHFGGQYLRRREEERDAKLAAEREARVKQLELLLQAPAPGSSNGLAVAMEDI